VAVTIYGQSEGSPEGPVEDLTLRVGYRTELGVMYWGTIEALLASSRRKAYEGQIQLIFTSPPFPLNRKKRYGNKIGEEYLSWLTGLAAELRPLLTNDGSIVMEMGNAWEPGKPVMSTLALRALLAFLEGGKLNLCQQFVCHNPAKLPTPAQWVNINRIRVKDSFTHLWWMAPTEMPKASNKNVLKGYSASMLELLDAGTYNSGERPSGHKIGEKSFLTNNGGAIPSNVLTYSNTYSNDEYRQYCKDRQLDIHPARMPPGLAEFFIKMLTDEGDLVLDPFAGSNTTGAVAESLTRRWVATEPILDYVDGSQSRFGTIRPGLALS
jgi:site-specific DNA-methyltransferase (cytosine-N4-specific)